MHGVYLGATLGSETTAAATGQVGVVRRDPMAMLPFIGYNIRDYLVHWFRMRKKMTRLPAHLPRQLVPQGRSGQIHLAGLRRKHPRAEMDHRPLPRPGLRQGNAAGLDAALEDIDLDGLGISREQFDALQNLKTDDIKAEIAGQEELFLKLAGDLPKEMIFQRELLISPPVITDGFQQHLTQIPKPGAWPCGHAPGCVF